MELTPVCPGDVTGGLLVCPGEVVEGVPVCDGVGLLGVVTVPGLPVVGAVPGAPVVCAEATPIATNSRDVERKYLGIRVSSKFTNGQSLSFVVLPDGMRR